MELLSLQDCHQLYMDTDNGLVEIAQNLDFTLLAPRKKISIMLIGNHSAGKSSFINW
jgi:predicted GTPase